MQFPITKSTILLPQGPFELFVPDGLAIKDFVENCAAEKTCFYWAKLWPSSMALAAFIQQHAHLVKGKIVAEIAGGIGLPSLIASNYARHVWCSDISKEAMEVATKSAGLHQLNNVHFEACSWSNLPVDFNAEVVLLSDINYDPDVFEELEKVLTGLLQKGCTLLLATPQRLMAKSFLEKLSGFIASSHEERVEANGQITFVSIFVLCLSKG